LSRTSADRVQNARQIGAIQGQLASAVFVSGYGSMGGEEDLLNLAVRLAISQMIAERSGQAFSLLVLDEVFGSLDEHRRLRVVELLRRLLDRFEQIVVMTHIEGTRDDLDHKIRIDYDDRTGESRVWSVDAAPMSIEDLGVDLLAAGAES
jgi:exonuclease SbcC